MSNVVSLSDRAKARQPNGFDDFYDAYPRKVGKGTARSAWARAIKIEDPAVIIAAAIRFAENCEQLGKEKRYIPHPTTWLNREGWDDELEEPDSSSGWDEIDF